MKVSVDADICLASGSCVRSVPEVFRTAGDGTAYTDADAEVAAELVEDVLDAAESCPIQAILLQGGPQ